jgi:4-hydroxythreonine-4-phosphate dehydrogenase
MVPKPSQAPPIALTMGDPAGVAGEITLKAWQELRDSGPVFFAITDPDSLTSSTDMATPITIISSPDEAHNAFATALPVLPVKLNEVAVPRHGDSRNADVIIASIVKAVEFCQQDKASAVVTNPINKAVLYQSGFTFPGHTELLASLAGPEFTSIMMLACEELAVVPLTLHVSLSDAIRQIDGTLIEQTVVLVHNELQSRFGIQSPRIVLSGLNPHAGEQGSMGREELDIIEPAATKLRARGFDVAGPLPADTMFHASARSHYDVAICMTHDQALIPIKTIAFDDAVNITLGLPFIRTSPDHGTAFDIAGQNKARPDSLIAAIRKAAEMAASDRI